MTTTDEECEKHLATLEHGLLALEQGDTSAGAVTVRAAHAISTAAVQAGSGQIGELACAIERALTPFYSQLSVPTAGQVTILLRAVDNLRALYHHPEQNADLAAVLGLLAGLSTSGTLRMLVVEDDFTSRLLLHTFLSRYGECHVAVNGREAVEAVRASLDRGQIYQLICMDIMMPELDGEEAVRQIRALEEARGISSTKGAKIFMTTAVNDLREVIRCFQGLCDAYLVKPIALQQLHEQLKSHSLVK